MEMSGYLGWAQTSLQKADEKSHFRVRPWEEGQ